MDVLDRADLPFPHSLPEFQRLFPDDAACAAYLEKARWGDGFACPHCGTAGEPFHFENRVRASDLSELLLVIQMQPCPWRPALPQVPPEHRADGGNSDGA